MPGKNGLDKQRKPRSDCFSSLIRVYAVCYSDKHFANCECKNKMRSVCNFKIFLVYLVCIFLQLYKMYSDNQYPPPPVDLIRVPAFLGKM